jgi:hypothetical protein
MSEMVLSVLFISTASSRLTQEQLKELVDKNKERAGVQIDLNVHPAKGFLLWWWWLLPRNSPK